MGSDDLFRRRKARREAEHRRTIASRAPYERVLIVCEGAKTEPEYFAWLRNTLRLNRANVVIADKRQGLDPLSLVRYAIEAHKKEPDFDHVYCVFDKDKHSSYDAALNKIKAVRLAGGARLYAISSIPCFEFWLLLHFTYTTRQYDAPLNASNCELVVQDLRKYIVGYEKGSIDFGRYLNDKTEIAIKNAKQLEAFHETSGTDNPSTKVYVLVEYLKGLAR